MQRMLKTVAVAVAMLAVVFSGSLSAAETVGQLLDRAESARTSNPKLFSETLGALQARRAEADPLQQQRIEYLTIFKTAIYEDRWAAGMKSAVSLYDKVKDPVLKLRIGSLIVNLSAISRDFRVGFRYMDRNMAMRGRIKDPAERQYAVGAAALFYNQMGQFSLALKYADEVLAAKPEPRMSCFMKSTRLESLAQLDKLPGDDAPLEMAIADCAAIGELMAVSRTRVLLANRFAARGDVDKAISLLEGPGLRDVNVTRHPRLIAEVRAALAELRLKKGDLSGAAADAEATIALGKDIMSTKPLVDAYLVLHQVAQQRGDVTSALAFYKEYAKADKAHQSDVKARELAYEIVRHETQQKTQQIQLLERNNQVLRLQQNLERESAQKARLAMVFLTLLLIGVVLWVIHMRRHQSALRRLAQTDSLTGIANRHHFTQMAEKSLVDCARAGEPASLVMFDLDHFKAINDTYGHGAGDWVLRQVGRICASHCRKIDYIGRLGGEEFAVLLHGLDLPAAARLAEDCRARLAQIDTRESGYVFVVTASFGVTSSAQSGYDLSRLLSHADQMLYRAKHEGRNRVCVYSVEAAESSKAKRTPALTVVNT